MMRRTLQQAAEELEGAPAGQAQGADQPLSPGDEAPDAAQQGVDILHELTWNYEAWLWGLAWILLAALAGWLAFHIIYFALRRVLKRRPWAWLRARESIDLDELVAPPLRRPLLWLMPLLAIKLFSMRAVTAAGVPLPAIVVLDHVLSLALIAAVTTLVIGVLTAGERVMDAKHRVDVDDNLAARRMHTQVQVMKQVFVVLVIIVGVAAALMTFEGVRQFGAGLLASAGVAGLVLGLAARPLLENIIAGIQVALSQPIRMDDVIVIDGYFGRVMRITTTYVVVKVWDERELIVPFSRFLKEPFENWTHTTASITGTVYVRADYTMPVAEARKAFTKMIEDHPKWDKRAAGIQVTDADGRTMELRAVVSANNSSNLWDLRCDLREQFIDYIQRKHATSLPREREEHFEHPAGDEDHSAETDAPEPKEPRTQ